VTTVALLLALLGSEGNVQEMPLGFRLIAPGEALKPPPEPVACADDMTDFAPVPTPFDDDRVISYAGDDGETTKWTLMPGIVLSECGFVKATNTAIEHRRLKLELASLRVLWEFKTSQWYSAEVNYQQTVSELMGKLKEANQPSFWEEWDAQIVAVVSVVVTVAAIFATVEIYKQLAPQVVVQ